mmetsp:Transcript_29446/g.53445  ORF Transcript_29446/g.53445 Transcript_29446/m.53445 type:complete len:111 (+) Transcript_29446:207-539(+)
MFARNQEGNCHWADEFTVRQSRFHRSSKMISCDRQRPDPWKLQSLHYLWHVSPLLPVLTAIATMTAVMMLLMTACSDPGIIPRSDLQLRVPELQELVVSLAVAISVTGLN